MTDEIHTKLFDLIRDMQKELSDYSGSLKSHLDSSVIRVENYDQDIESLKARLHEIEEEVKALNNFKVDYEGQKKGWGAVKTNILFGITFITALSGWITYLVKAVK